MLLTTLITVVVVGAAFVGLNARARANARQLTAEEVSRNQRALLALQQQELRGRLLTLAVLTESPTLRAAIDTYRLEARTASSDELTQLVATIQAEVGRMRGNLGEDLIVVTDDRGRVLASQVSQGVAPAPMQDLSSWEGVRQAVDPASTLQTAGISVTRVGDAWYQMSTLPIVLGGFTIGTLSLGNRFDQGFVDDLRRMFRGEVVLALPGRLVSTLAEANHAALEAEFVGLSVAEEGARLDIGSEEFVVASSALGMDETGGDVALYLIESLTEASRPIESALRRSFLIYGVLALLLAALGGVWVARSVLEPLRSFVAFMDDVSGTREGVKRFDTSDAPAEIATLGEAYNRLMGSLESQHVELESRTDELARTNEELLAEIGEREQAVRALRESEEQLRQAQKLESLGTLAGGIAHDFNNILTVISSYSELLLVEVEPDSSAAADLRQVREAVRRAASLTQQLLAFSRKQVLQPKVIDLNGVVSNLETMLGRLIGEHIEIRTVKGPTLGRVKADPSQIEQVLMNLAVNARDAMPRGGTLTIETANVALGLEGSSTPGALHPGPHAMLRVSDTGTGMDADTRSHVFEPFFTTKEAGKGTGLGLATVYGIIQQSNGDILVESAPGEGTTFRIYLPLVEELASSRRAEVQGPALRNGTETILVAEDEAEVRKLVVRVLEGCGYKVHAMADAEEALRFVEQTKETIDLLLTDVVMPRMSGKELAEALEAKRPETRVLFMSGYTDDFIGHHGVLDPGIELIQKPFSPEAIARRVRVVLDRPAGGWEGETENA